MRLDDDLNASRLDEHNPASPSPGYGRNLNEAPRPLGLPGLAVMAVARLK